jgi:hypothetical protein
LAIVTLTAFVPPGRPDLEGLELPLEWLHAATETTATALKAGMVSQNSRDRHRPRAVRFAINGFPLLSGFRAVAAP